MMVCLFSYMLTMRMSDIVVGVVVSMVGMGKVRGNKNKIKYSGIRQKCTHMYVC